MGSVYCCFTAKDRVEDNIENANNHDGFIPNLYNKIKQYAASISIGRTDSKNQVAAASSPSDSVNGELEIAQSGSTIIVQPPPVQEGLNEETRLNQSNPKSLKKSPSTALVYFYGSLEYEDECPTCLEEYTPENPKTTMQCSHHYHLACIYEWMERSQTCPICCRVMLFNEVTTEE